MTARSRGFGSGPIAGALSGRALFPSAQPFPSGYSAPLTGIGKTLREARETRGVSYAEAERDTHIPRHHLQALEEERFDALAARVYVRGFLRSYAQYLSLDAAELVALLPPDRPVEDERLLPLARLGRPRGPREAARARRHPLERDATPLTEATLARSEPSDAHAESESTSATPRLSLAQAADGTARQASRLDPLGRLGWPAASGREGAPERSALLERPLYEPEIDEAAPNEATPHPLTRERPLAPRNSTRRGAPSPILEALPADVRLLFSRRALPGVCTVAAALIVFYALAMALGGDTSPAVLASTGTGSVPVAAATIPAAPSIPRGRMLDLRGRDVQAAEGALRQLGIVPVVAEQTSAGSLSGQVLAQTPAPGSPLRSDTPVLLVVGQP